MDDRLLDKIAEPFNLKLPEYTSMREMIEEVLDAVRPYSETTFDPDGPLYRTNWVRLTDNPGDTVLQLHRFLPDGSLKIVNDGVVETSTYEIMDGNRIIIGDEAMGALASLGKSPALGALVAKGANVHLERYLYELAFLDDDFLLLRRHGNDANFVNKFLLYVTEPLGTRLTWDEALERLVAKYRNNNMPWWLILAVLFTIALIVLYLS